ncbi:hypothetical protein [Streptomyces sp. NPDC002690]
MGILVPVLGLVVTLVVGTSGSASRGVLAPPSATAGDPTAPGASAPTGAPESAAPDETPADDVVTSSSPSPSPSETSTKVIKRGDFTLTEGSSANLEHGVVGTSVPSPDMAWSGGESFSPLNGHVADSPKGATPRECAHMLTAFPQATGEMNTGEEGTWFCLPTSANHLAAVEWLGSGDGGMRFHFIVWDTPAPSDDE